MLGRGTWGSGHYTVIVMSQPHLSPNDPFVIRNTDNCHQAVDIKRQVAAAIWEARGQR